MCIYTGTAQRFPTLVLALIPYSLSAAFAILKNTIISRTDSCDTPCAHARAAVGQLQPDEKLLVVAATKSTAKAYARYCQEHGLVFVKYDGDSGKNKQDFRDPDAAWADKQVVIWNTVVTVGIDPTTTFKEFFLSDGSPFKSR